MLAETRRQASHEEALRRYHDNHMVIWLHKEGLFESLITEISIRNINITETINKYVCALHRSLHRDSSCYKETAAGNDNENMRR